jgi:hypothetical protein
MWERKKMYLADWIEAILTIDEVEPIPSSFDERVVERRV